MLKKSFSLVLLMSLMGTVVSLGAQELPPSSCNVSPLTSAVGNDISDRRVHTLYATLCQVQQHAHYCRRRVPTS